MVGISADDIRSNQQVLLAEDLAGLFGAGVVVAELRGGGDPSDLFQVEKDALTNCSEKRISDFAAGRQCARRALAGLGLARQALLIAADRLPHWPVGIVGSITHTAGYAAAVVAEARHVAGLGLDAECVAAVTPDIWPRICTAVELAHLRRLPEAAREQAAAVVFAAKEAFYKCQYPLTRQWLEFDDVSLECPDWAADHSEFGIQGVRGAVPAVAGRFLIREGLVIAGARLK